MSSGRRSLRLRPNTADQEGNNPALELDDSDEDDNEYIPDPIDTEDDDAEMMLEEEDDEDDEDNDEYMDFEDEENGQEQGDFDESPQRHEDPTSGAIYMTREELMGLLARSGIRRSLLESIGIEVDGDDGEQIEVEEEEEVMEDLPRRRSTRPRRRQSSREPVPNSDGQDLMFSGTFGNNERRANRVATDKRLARRLLERELGGYSYGREKVGTTLMKQEMIPDSTADSVITYDARCYSGQFSADGSFFFCCTRDLTQVRMYDTSNPYKWKYYKSITSPDGSWTVTDASLSSDNRWLAISTLASAITLAPSDPSDESPVRSLDFAKLDNQIRGRYRGYGYFYLFSVRWSGDNRELVGGSGDNSIYVYDIERGASVLRIEGHDNDVNAVCFGDENSPHILYSGSDDATIKVWDRRSLAGGRPAGVFLGHTEGLTYVDSKGDGLYVISNGKDQTAKLWDLRKIHSAEKAAQIDTSAYSQDWDYRGGHYDMSEWRKHPYDCSLVTFRGHAVEKTLIRCHFSPPGSSDGRYVYSGSRDGKVYIWNMDATLKTTLDVSRSASFMRDGDRPEMGRMWDGSMRYETVVRDASWHPYAPVIAATAWNGWGTDEGVCTIHSWNDGAEEDESAETKGVRYNSELGNSNERPRRMTRRVRYMY